ncbi:MAG: hypothetical protein IPP14_11535 [Planctomycetes bacterium]|nr:hypothetical protein [Planctomycetota bacterium]
MFRRLQRPATMFGFVPATRASAPAGQMHRPRVRGSQGTADEIPRLVWKPGDYSNDATLQAFFEADEVARKAKAFALATNWNSYPQEAWDGPAMDIYTAARLYNDRVANIAQAIKEGAAPLFTAAKRRTLDNAGAAMAHAVRVADALLSGLKDRYNSNAQAVRSEIGADFAVEGNPWLALIPGAPLFTVKWSEVDDYVAHQAEAVAQGAENLIKRTGKAVGEGISEGIEASMPWGPIVALAVGAVAVAVIVSR